MTKETCISHETSCSWIASHMFRKFQQKHYEALFLETQNTLALKKLQDLENQLDEAEFLKYKYKKKSYYINKDKMEWHNAKKALERLKKHIYEIEKKKVMKSLVEMQIKAKVDEKRHQLVCDFLKRRIFEEIQEKEEQEREIKELYERTRALQQQLEVQYRGNKREKKLLKKSQKLVQHLQLRSIHAATELSQMSVTNIQLKSVQKSNEKTLLEASVKLRKVKRQNVTLNEKILLIQHQFRLCYNTKQQLQHQLKKGARCLLKLQDQLNRKIHQLYLITDQLECLRMNQKTKQQLKDRRTQKLFSKTQTAWKSLQALKKALLQVNHQTQLDKDYILSNNKLLIQSNEWLRNESRLLKHQLEEAFDSMSELHCNLNTLKLQLYEEKQSTFHSRIKKNAHVFLEKRKPCNEKTLSENICTSGNKNTINTCSSMSECIKTNDSINVTSKRLASWTKSNTLLKGAKTPKSDTSSKSDIPSKIHTSTKGDTPMKGDPSTKGDTPSKGAKTPKSDIPLKSHTPPKSFTSTKSDTPMKGDTPIKSQTFMKAAISMKCDTPMKGDSNTKSGTLMKGGTFMKGDTPMKGQTFMKAEIPMKCDTPIKSDSNTKSGTPTKGDTLTKDGTPMKGQTFMKAEILMKGDTPMKGDFSTKNGKTPKGGKIPLERKTRLLSKGLKSKREPINVETPLCSPVSALKESNFLKRRNRKSLSILSYKICDNPSKLLNRKFDSSNESAESLDVEL